MPSEIPLKEFLAAETRRIDAALDRLTPAESTIRLGRDSPAGALLVTTSKTAR